jgi:hypothetical protein
MLHAKLMMQSDTQETSHNSGQGEWADVCKHMQTIEGHCLDNAMDQMFISLDSKDSSTEPTVSYCTVVK